MIYQYISREQICNIALVYVKDSFQTISKMQIFSFAKFNPLLFIENG